MNAPLRPWQVYRRADGRYAYAPDGAPLQAEEMLIGRGFDATEALEIIEELHIAQAKVARVYSRA